VIDPAPGPLCPVYHSGPGEAGVRAAPSSGPAATAATARRGRRPAARQARTTARRRSCQLAPRRPPATPAAGGAVPERRPQRARSGRSSSRAPPCVDILHRQAAKAYTNPRGRPCGRFQRGSATATAC